MEALGASELGDVLCNQDAEIGPRMRAVFFLRTLGTDEALDYLAKGLSIKGDSVLLRHETAYVLGQMQNDRVIPVLASILSNVEDDPVVRHEAAEAIGAIGHLESLALIEKYTSDERPEVSETCKIAAKRLRWLADNSSGNVPCEYDTIDPAPPLDSSTSLEEAVSQLLNVDIPLFVRYQAMFFLRNMGGEDAVLGLAKGLKDSSALFRHEIAYVLGQMAHEASVPGLQSCLEDLDEHGMVRHEAAEALGAVGNSKCVEILRRFSDDPEPLVSESCVTALDSVDYWEDFEKTNE